MRRALLCLAVGLACAGRPEPQGADAALFQSWVRVAEEEAPENLVQIYRPGGLEDFPPSRFRERYVFHADGRCEWSSLDAADAHATQSGTWSLDAARLLRVRDRAGHVAASFRIVVLKAELLELTPLEP